MPDYSPNAQVALTNFWAWNERDFGRGIDATTPDFVCVEVATGETYEGHAGLRDEYEKWATALSDGKCDINTVIENGDWVAVETTVSGTHDGVLITPTDEFLPTGHPLSFAMCTIHHIRDGKEDVRRHYFDQASIDRQLRAV